MKEKLQRFMYGRYGVDAFSKFLMGLFFAGWVLDLFVDNRILSSWTILILIYTYYRIFSKNCTKRYQENQQFLRLKARILSKFRKEQSLMNQRKTHHIYKCPTCKQKIRVPKGKGRICITCPKCKTEFTKTS